ncbi:MAG TPA: type II toxin-antitoxin system RatA family toxin [Steroidobacteraceae bacterium]|nr:type II toxin-antitoxin system RatA family toxin [Steroidobacteraceae bacterium]
MKVESTGSALPYRCDQVFDLIAGIERYPEFLSGWLCARVVRRQADTLYVEQTVGFAALRLSFSSTAVLQRPHSIEISSTDEAFRRYSLRWHIQPVPPGCRIGVVAEIELASRLLQLALQQVMGTAIDDAIRAFEARAEALYGSGEAVAR